MKIVIIALLFFASTLKATAPNASYMPLRSITATETSVKVCESNPYRNYLIIQNRGKVSVVVKFGAIGHTSDEGIEIYPGGNYEPFLPPNGPIWIKSIGGSSRVEMYTGQ